jgi:hypothetical protein
MLFLRTVHGLPVTNQHSSHICYGLGCYITCSNPVDQGLLILDGRSDHQEPSTVVYGRARLQSLAERHSQEAGSQFRHDLILQLATMESNLIQ